MAQGLRLLTVNIDHPADPETLRMQVREQRLSFPILRGSEDVAGIYNILYRHLFDRHRDLSLPTSFLIDDKGQIVKVYQGSVNPEQVEQDFHHIPQTYTERLARALPFPGVTETFEFGRNYLSYGSVFFQRGYFDQAEASFQLALQDDPSSAEACYGLGSAYLNQQKTAEARESFEPVSYTHLDVYKRQASYSAQMLRGIDYWRTVLDGASGIDIYGHNGVSVADIDNDGFDDLYVCQPAGLQMCIRDRICTTA